MRRLACLITLNGNFISIECARTFAKRSTTW